MSGSSSLRSRTGASAVTAAISRAAVVSSRRKPSHWRGPSTRTTRAPVDASGPAAPRGRRRAFAPAVALLQRVEVAVVDHAPVVDHEQPRAQPLDVVEVVRRQQHGHAALGVDLGEELPHSLLRHDVEADRRLVEEEDLRVVQHRGGQLAAHALAERELPHRRARKSSSSSSSRKRSRFAPVAVVRDPVDVAQQLERVASGRSHQSWMRWPNTTPMRRASSMRCRDGSSPATGSGPPTGRGCRSAS